MTIADASQKAKMRKQGHRINLKDILEEDMIEYIKTKIYLNKVNDITDID